MVFTPCFQSALQEPFSLYSVRRIEEGAKLPGNGLLRLLPRRQLTGVLLQVERTALPGHGRQQRTARGLEPRMVVGDDELHPLQSTGKKPLQKAAPVDLGFGCARLAAQHPALARSLDADCDQCRAVDDRS
jgi:hypothetical protein